MAKGFGNQSGSSYPRGKIHATDEGKIETRMAIDPTTNTLILDYGKPVHWIGWGPDEAFQFLLVLAKNVSQLKGVPISVSVESEETTENPTNPQTGNPIAKAAETLLLLAIKAGKPLLMTMHPPGNDHGLKEGELQVSNSSMHEVRPSCDGLVVAVGCSPTEAQELSDLILKWQQARIDAQGN